MSSSTDTHVLARAFLRLARTGAYAKPDSEPGSDYLLLSPRNAFAAPLARLSAGLVAEAQTLGWLTEAPDGSVRLSKSGRRAMKRAFGTAGANAPTGNVVTPRAQPSAPQRVEGPLLWLRNRKDRSGKPLITHSQYAAGARFAEDYVRGRMQPRVTASWSITAPCVRGQGAGGALDITDAALAARNRFYRAMAAVGPELGALLVDVCCLDIGLETAERTRHWPVRSGKVVLDMGLTGLARHYGLEAQPTARASQDAAPRPRGWTAPGYNATLAAWSDAPATTTPPATRRRAANRAADATMSA